MKEQFETFNFRNDTLATIQQAVSIVDDFKARGYSLTLRQLYYQFVAKDLIPNTERSYKALGETIRKARYAGMISWTDIEDRTRSVSSWLIEEDETSVLDGIEYGISFDYWSRQGVYCEVWVEKEALSDVVAKPSRRWKVPYLSCRGYLSASEAWRAGKRFERARADGNRCVIFHLGDHDPSGIDMSRDNADRNHTLSWGSDVEFKRLALNMDQIEQYRPPENPAKLSDSRAGDYVAQYGYSSWELDALDPQVIDDLIDKNIRSLIDEDMWAATRQEERDARGALRKLYTNWSEVKEFLRDL